MSRLNLALAGGAPGVTGANLIWVVVVAVIALLALGVAGVLVRQVLAAGQGTEKNEKKQVPPVLARILQGSPEDFIKRFDKNKDGYLSKDELPGRLQRS